MTSVTTTHYDFDQSRGRTMLVLDAWKACADAVDNDVIPSTRENLVISGIENPASNLSSSSNTYTTIPLRPCSQNVNFLLNNFINVSFEFTLQAKFSSDLSPNQNLPDFAVYFPSAAAIPSRIQLLCGNSIVWQNQFQRYEAILAMNALPGQIIDNNAEYTTMEKLLHRKDICGTYINTNGYLQSHSITSFNNAFTITFTIDTNIDLNALTPLLSNIPFLTSEMGDLRLRLFFENLEHALCITPLPKLGYFMGDASTISLNAGSLTVSINNGAGTVKFTDTPTGGNAANFEEFTTTGSTITGSGTGDLSTLTNSTAFFRYSQIQKYPVYSTFGWFKTDGTFVSDAFTFSNLSWKSNSFGVQIVQDNFTINDYSKAAILQYIAHDNRLVIPTQTWSTALATTAPNTTTQQEFIFQISAFNIYAIGFLFPFWSASEVCLPNPYISFVDCMLNSKSLSYIPYTFLGSRALKDTIQACLNDDKWGPNCVLQQSFIERNMSGVDYTDTTTGQLAYSSVLTGITATNSNHVYNSVPNQFSLIFGLSPPNSFQKGYCMASNNPQSTQIRLKSNICPIRSSVDVSNGDEICTSVNGGANNFQIDYNNSGGVQPVCLCLQDCCLVLEFNPALGSCQTGSVAYAEAYHA